MLFHTALNLTAYAAHYCTQPISGLCLQVGTSDRHSATRLTVRDDDITTYF